MKQAIKASEQNLIAVFGDEYLFRIPVYQRPYAWTIEQVDELLDDLVDAMKRDPEIPYFLGSIVLIKSEESPQSQVVDGQQRLTTLAMIFCVLRELEQYADQGDIDDFVRQKGNPYKGTVDQFRLRLRDRDKAFFDDFVQTRGAIPNLLELNRSPLSDSQQRIAANVSHIHFEFGQLSPNVRRRLLKFIAQRCYLVVVTATDRDSAYRIFSVMNDRGLDLSPTDILKAESIGELPEGVQSVYGEKWESIEDELGREDFRDLFTHIRMIKAKSKLRQSLQADFQQRVLANSTGIQFVDQILLPYAEIYESIRNASFESATESTKINKYLSFLGRLDNFDWIPPALEFFTRHTNNPGFLIAFVTHLERLAYGMFIRRAYLNERISRYSEVLRAIERNEDLFSSDSPLQLDEEEQSDILRRLDGDIYLQPYVLRRVLLERLDSLVAESGAIYDHSIVSIEHVLPQNPAEDSEWSAWFPTQELRDRWTHKLANLVLLSRRKNSRASNWEFERKKKEYFQRNGVSRFPLTTQVINESQWTPAVLEVRQTQLLGALSTEWRLHSAGSNDR